MVNLSLPQKINPMSPQITRTTNKLCKPIIDITLVLKKAKICKVNPKFRLNQEESATSVEDKTALVMQED
jgi:hypothetical protein